MTTALIPKVSNRPKDHYYIPKKVWVNIIASRAGKTLVSPDGETYYYVQPGELLSYDEYLADFVRKQV